MSRRVRNTVLVLLALVLVAALFVLARKVWDDHHESGLETAMSMVPRETLRLSYTDWAAVRRESDVKLGRHPSAATIEKFLGNAYDTDLSAVSSIDEATVALDQHFGFSAVNANWEAYAQSREGAAMVLRLPDDYDFKALRKRLTDLGFKRPARATGVWIGGIDLIPAIDPSITPELQFVVVLADQHAVVTSDGRDYAATAAKVARGAGGSLADLKSSAALARQVTDPIGAMLWSGDFACSDLAMSQADDTDEALAKDLVARAGKVSAMSGLLMAMTPSRDLDVVEGFASAGQAQENLDARAKLAVGPAVGRGGSFADDYRLVESKAVDSSVVLRLRPKERTGFVLSALDSGPVVFATC